MPNHRNVLTVLGCSGSLALALSISQPAFASQAVNQTDLEHGLTNLVEQDSNPIMDALGCSCASCLLGQQSSSI